MSLFCPPVSVLGRRWELRQPEQPPALPEGLDVSTEVVAIAAARGVTDIGAFLRPTFRQAMPDPFTLAGMQQAVVRTASAIVRGEKIAIFGDYDVDGATSVSLLLRQLQRLGVRDTRFHIPQRLTEGYGPNIPAIEALAAAGVQLLIIADSGTGAIAQIARARELGLDVIVLDHHEPNEDGSLPPAIVVNPKLPANDGSLAYLCTAGLAFLFLVGLNRELRQSGFFARGAMAGDGTAPAAAERLVELLGLVALGTVADVVPLRGLNRAYVRLGLESLSAIPGIAALMRATADDGHTVRACGFVLGPCINAAGRISDTTLGTRLLTSDDPAEADALAGRLNALNLERRRMQEEMVEACCEAVGDPGPEDAVLVLYDEAWHPGVVGICASKIKDRFDRTAIVIGSGGKGSGRSVEGFDIGRMFLRATADGLLIKGGGHGAAGGLTVAPDKVDAFRAFMQDRSRGLVRPPTQVDLAVRVGDLSLDAVDSFELLAPFGMGNPRPRIAITGAILDSVRILKGRHIRAALAGPGGEMELIAFNAVGTPLGEAIRAAEGCYVDVLGDVSINSYGGNTRLQVKPTDLMVGRAVTEMAVEGAASLVAEGAV